MSAAPLARRARYIALAVPLVFLTQLSLSSCSDQSTAAHGQKLTPAPASLDIISGNQQVGPPNTELPSPVVVRALSSSGTPIAGQIINFKVTSGGGSMFAGVDVTNQNGYAQDYWKLGPTSGVNTVEARAVDPTTGSRLVFAQLTATAAVSVATVTVTPTSGTLSVGGTLQLAATAKDSTGATVPATFTWTTSNAAVATVSSSGLVTALASGGATITATTGGKSAAAAITVSSSSTSVATVSVTPSADTLAAGKTLQLSSTAHDASGATVTGTTTWASSNVGVATVSSSGLVTAMAAGTAKITATVSGVSGSSSTTVTSTVSTTSSGEPALTVGFNNTPTGMTVLSDVDLNTLSGTWKYVANTATASIVTDPTSPINSSVFQFNYPQGFAGGYAPAALRAPGLPDASGTHNYKELYFAFYWKADTAWQNHSSDVNKVAFGWRSNTSTFGMTWDWWGGTDNNGIKVPPQSMLVFGFGATVGNTYITPNQPNLFSLQPGRWYKVEWYVKLASTATSNDGIVRVWVNDRLTMNYTDRSGGGYLSDAYFDPVWGGMGDTKAHTDFYRLAHAKIAVR